MQRCLDSAHSLGEPSGQGAGSLGSGRQQRQRQRLPWHLPAAAAAAAAAALKVLPQGRQGGCCAEAAAGHPPHNALHSTRSTGAQQLGSGPDVGCPAVQARQREGSPLPPTPHALCSIALHAAAAVPSSSSSSSSSVRLLVLCPSCAALHVL